MILGEMAAFALCGEDGLGSVCHLMQRSQTEIKFCQPFLFMNQIALNRSDHEPRYYCTVIHSRKPGYKWGIGHIITFIASASGHAKEGLATQDAPAHPPAPAWPGAGAVTGLALVSG